MRVKKEFLIKALDEGFIVILKVDDKVVGSVVRVKARNEEDYVYLSNKGFSATQKLDYYKELKASRVELANKKIVLRG